MNRQRIACDVLVVGAGPAGLAAACMSAEMGQSTAIIDQAPELGGQIWRGESTHASQPAAQRWLQRLHQAGVSVYSRATAFAASSSHGLLVETPNRVLEIGWHKLILATGARELFIPYPGWTLPGVLGPGGLHAMAKAGWPVAGKRVVVAGTGPLLLAVADSLKQLGAKICLIAEQAPWARVMGFGLGLARYPVKLAQGLGIKARLIGVPYRCGCWPVKAEGADRVRQVELTNGVHSWTEACDYLACGFHLLPNVELPRLLGCRLTHGFVRVDEFQVTTAHDVFCAGEPTGVGGAECALIEGQIAGLAAAGKMDEARARFGERERWHRFRQSLNAAFGLRPALRELAQSDTIVCRCEDIRRHELEPFSDWRSAKLQTRCGMGPCQGRTCGAAARVLFNWDPDSVRPPVYPVSLGAMMTADGSMHNSTSTRTQPTP
jgi:D-hydroxyproline dehydrogenase subunit alpha